jgi:hypothetical protein
VELEDGKLKLAALSVMGEVVLRLEQGGVLGENGVLLGRRKGDERRKLM